MYDIERYSPLLLSFILDYSDRSSDPDLKDFHYLKKGITNVIERCTEPEDRAYLYSSEDVEIPGRKGGVMPHLAAAHSKEFDLGEAIRQCLYLMSLEDDYEYRWYVFCITDRYSKEFEYSCRKMQGFDERNYWECNFVFCGIGDHYDKDLENLCDGHARTHYWHLDSAKEFPDKISEFIKSLTGKEEKIDGTRQDVPDERELQDNEDAGDEQGGVL